MRYWVAGCSVSEDLWRYRKESATVACDPRGRALEGTQGVLVWPDYLAASELDTLIVEGEGLDEIQFELWWSADDSFTPDRSIGPVRSVEPVHPGQPVRPIVPVRPDQPARPIEPVPFDLRNGEASAHAVRFELAGAPGWEGPIRRFRLTWGGTPSERTRIACAWGKLR